MTSYRVGFLMTQILGHIVHDQRLRLEIARDPAIEAKWMPIPPWAKDRWQRIPLLSSNLTLLSGFRAKDHLRGQTDAFDALYCHTQEAAVLLGKYMKRIPTILSMDATPINMDSIGLAYGHNARNGAVERVKHFLTKNTFHRAAHLVTFSQWAKNSLMHDYGIQEQKITVNAPGVDLARWSVLRAHWSDDDLSPRVLFVGGDFRRKGGDVLVQCARSMPRNWTVDIVTSEAVPNAEGLQGVHVHVGLKADTPELLELYRKVNIFALPTLADCSPLVILEAMAMGLPVIATRVGGIPEIVVDGETGLLIPPNSPEALLEAIRELGKNPERRRAMGIAGRLHVEKYFDGRQNYRALIALIKTVADRGLAEHR
jgi:glycosyltransferase involved in cell wall biosynthesis